MQEWNLASFILINMFIASFHWSTGGVAWLYTSEVAIDAASGFTSSGQFINCIIISFTFEYMINSPLKVYGTMWYFGIITLLGGFLLACFVRETRGLTDLEKKTLYTPKAVAVFNDDGDETVNKNVEK